MAPDCPASRLENQKIMPINSRDNTRNTQLNIRYFSVCLSDFMSFSPDHSKYLIYILLAEFIGSRFHHDTDHRLSTTLPYQDPSVGPKGF